MSKVLVRYPQVWLIAGLGIGLLLLNAPKLFRKLESNSSPPISFENANEENNNRDSIQEMDLNENTSAEAKAQTKNLLSLLYFIAEDQAKKEGYVHRGVSCDMCRTSPIRGIRYRCTNCLDYDLCEQCEASNSHDRTHVFWKLKVPVPTLSYPRLYRGLDVFPGNPDALPNSLTFEQITELKSITAFEQSEIECLYEQFSCLATERIGPDSMGPYAWGISRSTFDRCLGRVGTLDNLIIDRIFNLYDQNNDGVIGLDEFYFGLNLLTKGRAEKIIYMFQGYDVDRKGYIDKSDVHRILYAYHVLAREMVRDMIYHLEDDLVDVGRAEDAMRGYGGHPVSVSFQNPFPDLEREENGNRDKVGDDEVILGPSLEAQYEGENAAVLESVFSDAIEKMVDNIFEDIEDDKMELPLFSDLIKSGKQDNLGSWIDSIGPVF